jgi:hypothetical protein
MGVKVVSVKRRDTPTRYDLLNVRVVNDEDESDVPTDRMVFSFSFPQLKMLKIRAVAASPPPTVHLSLSELLRVFREGTDIGWIMTHFRKSSPYGFEIKSCHRWTDIDFT